MYGRDPQNPERPVMDYTCEILMDEVEAPCGELLQVQCMYWPHRHKFCGDVTLRGEYETKVLPDAEAQTSWLFSKVDQEAQDIANNDDDAWTRRRYA